MGDLKSIQCEIILEVQAYRTSRKQSKRLSSDGSSHCSKNSSAGEKNSNDNTNTDCERYSFIIIHDKDGRRHRIDYCMRGLEEYGSKKLIEEKKLRRKAVSYGVLKRQKELRMEHRRTLGPNNEPISTT